MQRDGYARGNTNSDTEGKRALDADLLLVGGGLANGLIAWRLKMLRPALRILLLEAGSQLGGNHTWCFHDSDLEPAQREWMAPLISHHWPQYDVAFPQKKRSLQGGYSCVTSTRFNAVLSEALKFNTRTQQHVTVVTPTTATLADGTVLRASAVIDGRGVLPTAHHALGYQNFLGQELQLKQAHGLTSPVLMDARVAQHGGYRFIYLLPFTANTVLVEDTVYADGARLPEASYLRDHIAQYAKSKGWEIDLVLREEQGILPITLDGDAVRFWDAAGGVPRVGLAAGLFHPTTGYSLPEAVRVADLICAMPDIQAASLFTALRQHGIARWKAQWFFRILNRMLFRAAIPDQRWRVMQRFYGLPAPLIARFYASKLTFTDKLRILSGKPPVPLAAAWRATRAQYSSGT